MRAPAPNRSSPTAAAPRNYLPIDGLAAYDKAVQATAVRRRQRRASRTAASSPCRRWAAPAALKVGARFPAPHQSRAPNSGSATRAGKTTARCSNTRASRSTPTRITTRRRTASISTPCSPRSTSCRRARSCVLHACCHNPTGVDLTPAQWEKVIEVVKRARPRAVPRHRLPGLCRRPRRRRRCRCAALPRPARRCSCRARSRNRCRSTANASAR